MFEKNRFPRVMKNFQNFDRHQKNILSTFLVVEYDPRFRAIVSALNDDPRLWAVAIRNFTAHSMGIAAFCQCENGTIIPFKCYFSYSFSKFYLWLQDS